jgi:hypothetical protein
LEIPARNNRDERRRYRPRDLKMGYREDPEARSTLNAAFTGLGLALVFLLIVGGIAFFWAYNAH